MEKKLKVAIVGAGKMGIHHIIAIKRLPHAKLIAVVDPFPIKEKINAAVGKNIPIYLTLEHLFKNHKPDVIHIVTPPNLHYKYAKYVLENDCNVIVEKPFTETYKQAKELIEIATNRRLSIAAGHQLLFQNPIQAAKNKINYIKDIVYIESFFSFKTVRRGISSTDQIMDILPHPVYTMLEFMNTQGEEDDLVLKGLHTDASGEVTAIVTKGKIVANLIVSLSARPVDSYLKIMGTNGSIEIDFVRSLVKYFIGPGADTISAIINPIRLAFQTLFKTIHAVSMRALKKQKSYPGLYEFFSHFYGALINRNEDKLYHSNILRTVEVCERIEKDLREKEKKKVALEKQSYEQAKQLLSIVDRTKKSVCVTGGTGFLGRNLVSNLVAERYSVKVLCRNLPQYRDRISGVEYYKNDLATGIDDEVLKGIDIVVHCAAETVGGKEEHEKNTVDATQKLINSCIKKKVNEFIHISSLAVLKPGYKKGIRLNENSEVDFENIGRGPYVWGKATAEKRIENYLDRNDIDIKILRPGPLVDYNKFEAPGRLGKEIGTTFIVMGSKDTSISICDVNDASRIIKFYIDNFKDCPSVLNMIEPKEVKRHELFDRLKMNRPELKALYIPTAIVKFLSNTLKLVHFIVFPFKKPIDIESAFASEKYDTLLVNEILNKISSNNFESPSIPRKI